MSRLSLSALIAHTSFRLLLTAQMFGKSPKIAPFLKKALAVANQWKKAPWYLTVLATTAGWLEFTVVTVV
jgi:hypothetical protein